MVKLIFKHYIAAVSTTGIFLGALWIAPIGQAQRTCDSSYPDLCLSPPPPDLDCGDLAEQNFRVLQPDPHGFDGDRDGIGCEATAY